MRIGRSMTVEKRESGETERAMSCESIKKGIGDLNLLSISFSPLQLN